MAQSELLEEVLREEPRRFRRYPEYRDSGVEWLGEIPAHWTVQKLGRLTQCLDGRRVPLNAEQRSRMQGEYPYWGANSIVGHVDQWLFDEDLVLLGEDGAPFFDRSRPVAFHVKGKLWVNNHAHVLRARAGMDPSFLANVLNCVDYRAFIDGSTRDKLTQGDMNAIPVQLVPTEEQLAIARFLGRETAKIDALIAKKERLIELLEEKRSALITRAVTKGLDPNVPMKDSGVEWSGEIPAHWQVMRLGRVARIGNGSTPRREDHRYWVDGHVAWLTSGKVNERVITAADEFVTACALRECHLPLVPAGSVLVAITGEGQTRGRAAHLQISSTISQHLTFVTPDEQKLESSYTYCSLQSRYDWLRAESGGAGSTRAALTCEFLRSVVLAVPPPVEQRAIANYIAEHEKIAMSLISRIQAGVQGLKELRSALITAAVTGKIDVREEVA